MHGVGMKQGTEIDKPTVTNTSRSGSVITSPVFGSDELSSNQKTPENT